LKTTRHRFKLEVLALAQIRGKGLKRV